MVGFAKFEQVAPDETREVEGSFTPWEPIASGKLEVGNELAAGPTFEPFVVADSDLQ